ncbi:MAG: hypothetical protein JW924_08730 [Fusobacteriaceae bacterium]|nr:hypothetical protein [Fusobacteriaceae bacterium]
MNKDKLKGIQNPLLSRGSRVESPVIQQKSNEDNLKFIYKYGRTTNISENLVNYIDFEDKTFINRIYNNYDELYNDDLNDLIESIKEIGLLNTVYLLEKDEVDGKKFLIVSGLRRMLSIKKILEEQIEIREVNKIVIFQKDTPYELLNRMSIDENTKRKDLTLLELSYKLRKDAKENKKSIESLLEEHKLNRRKFFRITKVMDYPVELRDIVDEVGINKAETINKIFKHKKDYETYEDIVNACKSMSERDLDTYYKNISKKKKKIFEYKINSKNSELNIKIKRKVDEDLVRLVEEFKRRLEELK